MSTTKIITNPYKLVIVSLRSVETGERGYYIGEPMLAMADRDSGEHHIALSVDENVVTLSGDTPVGTLMDNLRKLLVLA